jgi:uncharacterized protein YndB with AHSA1/START domain
MAERSVASWNVDVQRSAEDTFAYLLDVSKHGEWSPKPFTVEGLSAGPVTQGATFTSYGVIPGDKHHRNDVVVTEVVPGERLVLEATEPDGAKFVNTFTVTSSGAGCRVEKSMDFPTPRGALGVVFPLLMRAYIRPQGQKGMNTLKANVEKS